MTFIEFVNEHLIAYRHGSMVWRDYCEESEEVSCDVCGEDKDVYLSLREENDALYRCLDCWEEEYNSNINPPKEEETEDRTLDTRLALVESKVTDIIRGEIASMREDMKSILEGISSMRSKHFELEEKVAILNKRFKEDRQFVEDVQSAMASSFPDTFAELKRKL